ncbi:MAG: zf-HC2 domain-containing protein [Actinomycetota bacterium]
MKKHDPEAAAARYLGGAMSRRARRVFEAHLMECPDCWEEVRLGGLGRGYAEVGRELAPQALRDRIRGEVSLTPHRTRIRLRIGVGVLALALGVTGGAFALLAAGQPRAIDALVADFHGDHRLEAAVPASLPERLGDLALVEVTAGEVDRLSVVGHRYRDRAGHRVTVYRADRSFPMADGARPGEGQTWRAEVEGSVLLCSDRPFPALLVGDDAREVLLAARVLGMV